jgi:hypothetical protein
MKLLRKRGGVTLGYIGFGVVAVWEGGCERRHDYGGRVHSFVEDGRSIRVLLMQYYRKP